MVLPTVIKKRHLKGGKSLPVIKRIRAGQPGGFIKHKLYRAFQIDYTYNKNNIHAYIQGT
jgi:hypothetical protein